MKSKRQTAPVVIGVAVGLSLALFSGKIPSLRAANLLVVALSCFLWHFPLVTLHELAHVLAGWFCDAHITTIAIGPIALRREGLRWKLKATSNNRVGGFAGTVPKSADRLREKMIVIIAAGPITTLATGTIGAILLWQGKVTGWWASVVAGGVLWSYLVGISELVITNAKGLVTDGGRLRMLLRNDERGVRWCSIIAVSSADQRGVRPGDWDTAFLQLMTRALDQSSDSAAAALLACTWASDRKDFGQAGDYLEKAMAIAHAAERLPPLLKTGILLCAASFEAEHRGHLDIARALWHSASPVPGEPEYLRLAAEAPILLAEGAMEKARESAAQALRLLPDPPVTGSQKMAVEGLREIILLAGSCKN